MSNLLMPNKVVFFVDGGYGKNIIATVPLRAIRKQYPQSEISVVCSHPEIFMFNPNCDYVTRTDKTENFYDKHFKDSDTLLLKAEPAESQDFVHKKKHFSEIWCDMLGLPFDHSTPDLFISEYESRIAEKIINNKPKQILIIQPEGGFPPTTDQPFPKNFVRDMRMKLAQDLVDKYKNDYHIFQFRAPHQTPLVGTETCNPPIRVLFAMIPFIKKFILIDSCLQHACAAMGQKATVIWAGTSPIVHGYDIHNNIHHSVCPQPYCQRPNRDLFDNNSVGVWDCPYSEACTNHKLENII